MATATTKKYYCDFEKPFGLEKHVFNLIWYVPAHIFGGYGLYLYAVGVFPPTRMLFIAFWGYFAGTGITVGCHRLWTHKTFKAKLPLQILLAWMQTTSSQYTIFKWCRDHRIHHKYVETEADPYNAKRGFWFCHILWLFTKEDPAVHEKANTLDFSDLDNDPVIRFQSKYYGPLLLSSFFLIPILTQHLLWPEMSLFHLICNNYIWYIISVHFTFLVNSAAHLWGHRPYEQSMYARENLLVSMLAVGEGFHNYHHTFPWDYKAAELGFYRFNWSTMFIDFFAWMGWAYDLKYVPQKVVQARAERTGDGSYTKYITFLHSITGGIYTQPPVIIVDANENTQDKSKDLEPKPNLPAWGWGDKDIPHEHFAMTRRLKVSHAN